MVCLRSVRIGLLLVLALFAAGSATAIDTAQASLVGTWDLESQLETPPARTPTNLGDRPVGRLMYDASGHMAAQVMRRDRQSTDAPSVNHAGANGTTSYDHYVAYFGNYTVDWQAHVVSHHVEGALSADDIGKTLIRHFELSGDTLRLWFETAGGNGTATTHTLTWRRVSQISGG